MFNKFFYDYGRSSEWKRVRKEFLKENPQCAACGRKEDLEVHHIVPYHISPERELDPSNLITLCGKYCHFVFGHLMDYKSWNKNVVEDCKKYYILRINRPRQEVFANTSKMEGYYREIFNTIFSVDIFNIIKRWHNRS